MTHLAMATVVGLRIDPIDLPHQRRQIGSPRTEYKMIVIAHQTIRQRQGVETQEHLAHHIEQQSPVAVVLEDRLAPVTPRGDVIHRAGKFDAKRAGQES